MARFLDVDPRTLHLPSSMLSGADLGKFARQFSKYGLSTVGMPAIKVEVDPDGRLIIIDGVTRATRVARFLPGQHVSVEVIGATRYNAAKLPTVAERLP